MFKNLKENNYVKKFLELWNTPRYRSLIILGLYFIFFVFVIATIRSGYKNNTTTSVTKKDVLEEYRLLDNYQYKMTIETDTNKTLIGQVYKDKQTFTYNNENYYISYGKVYIKNDTYEEIDMPLLDFDVWRFTPTFITNLRLSGKLDATTEYADKSISKTYLVPIKVYRDNYYDIDYESGVVSDLEESIKLTIYQNDTKVTKVELDLTSVYSNEDTSDSHYFVTIEYEFENQISPIIIDVEGSE